MQTEMPPTKSRKVAREEGAAVAVPSGQWRLGTSGNPSYADIVQNRKGMEKAEFNPTPSPLIRQSTLVVKNREGGEKEVGLESVSVETEIERCRALGLFKGPWRSNPLAMKLKGVGPRKLKFRPDTVSPNLMPKAWTCPGRGSKSESFSVIAKGIPKGRDISGRESHGRLVRDKPPVSLAPPVDNAKVDVVQTPCNTNINTESTLIPSNPLVEIPEVGMGEVVKSKPYPRASGGSRVRTTEVDVGGDEYINLNLAFFPKREMCDIIPPATPGEVICVNGTVMEGSSVSNGTQSLGVNSEALVDQPIDITELNPSAYIAQDRSSIGEKGTCEAKEGTDGWDPPFGTQKDSSGSESEGDILLAILEKSEELSKALEGESVGSMTNIKVPNILDPVQNGCDGSDGEVAWEGSHSGGGWLASPYP